MKQCIKCLEYKDESKFYRDKRKNWTFTKCKSCIKGYQQDNKEKHNESCRKYYWNNKNDKEYKRKRNEHLKRSYGITIDDYEILFNKQNGYCAICKRHQLEVKKTFHVDHCHITGKVRGLLCDDCNTGIGKLKENKFIFINAIEYLGIGE